LSERDEVIFIKPDEAESFRREWQAEALRDAMAQSRRYINEPSEAAWYELVRALSNVFGDAGAYDLLRATEIHTQLRDR
jgi:hypothetical protein